MLDHQGNFYRSACPEFEEIEYWKADDPLESAAWFLNQQLQENIRQLTTSLPLSELQRAGATSELDTCWVNYTLWNRMRDPGDGSIHQVALFSNLRYGGNNEWCYAEDIYNPAEMAKMVSEWNAVKNATENE